MVGLVGKGVFRTSERSRTSTIEHFCEDSYRLLAVNYFRKKLYRGCSTSL